MPRIFDISTAPEPVRIDAQGRGEVSFTITNLTNRPQRGQIKLRPQEATQLEWLTLAGEVVRDFSASAQPGTPMTQQATVQVKIPPGTPAGKYTFKIVVANENNPEEEYTDGPTVALEVPASQKPTPFPWWIVAIAAVGLTVGGVLVWLILRPKPADVQSVVGQPIGAARQTLENQGFQVTEVAQSVVTCDPKASPPLSSGIVVDQSPPPQTNVKQGSEIKLSVVTDTTKVKVPDVVTGKLSLEKAQQVLAACALKGVQTELKPTLDYAPGVVMSQGIPSGEGVALAGEVGLTVAGESVKVPENISGKDLNQALQSIVAQGLVVEGTSGDSTKLAEGTTPKGGELVLKGSKVTINFPCTSRFCGVIFDPNWRERVRPDLLRRMEPLLTPSPSP